MRASVEDCAKFTQICGDLADLADLCELTGKIDHRPSRPRLWPYPSRTCQDLVDRREIVIIGTNDISILREADSFQSGKSGGLNAVVREGMPLEVGFLFTGDTGEAVQIKKRAQGEKDTLRELKNRGSEKGQSFEEGAGGYL